MIVTLNDAELMIAAQVGVYRRSYHVKRQTQGRYGKEATGKGLYEADILSCQAELAVAKEFNLYWHLSIGDMTLPDVGRLVEVRSVKEPAGNLIVHPTDKSHAPFVCVYPDPPHFHLIGWLFGHEAKSEDNWERSKGKLRQLAFLALQEDLNQDWDALRNFCATLVAAENNNGR